MRKLPKFLTEQQVLEMAEKAPDPIDKLFIQVSYYLGTRISETLGLKWPDIDLNKGTCRIGWEKAKGSKERIVCIPAPLQKILKHWKTILNPDWPLFPFSTSTGYRKIVAAAERAGMPDWVSPHKLRHSMATHLLAKTKRLEIVQEALGHENIQSTRIYAHVCLEDRQAETAKVWG